MNPISSVIWLWNIPAYHSCLDAKDGKVAIDGWSKLSKHDVIDLAKHFEADGVEAIIYTDISRDGIDAGCKCRGDCTIGEGN